MKKAGALLVAVTAFVALAAVPVFLLAQNPVGGEVTITDSGFVPAVVTVPVRSVVTWTNTGVFSHTVTAIRGEFSSGIIPPGGVYSYLFTAPGEYPYRDLFSSIAGKVVVGEGVFRVYLPLVVKNR